MRLARMFQPDNEATDPDVCSVLDEDDQAYLGGAMHPDRPLLSGQLIDERRMLIKFGIPA